MSRVKTLNSPPRDYLAPGSCRGFEIAGVLIQMRSGDKDGFNEIYDGNGDLILHANEKKLVVEENVVPSLKSTWRYYGGEYLLEPSKGTMYLTNERLVFINIPERMFAIGGDKETRAMGAAVERNFDIGGIAPGAAVREYFEIPNIEVMASERKEGVVSMGEMVNVYILSSGNQYHLSMVLTGESDLLRRLMNKRVNDLDELVNNLKDYFRKTEWMFTDSEKKLYGGADKDSTLSTVAEGSKMERRIPDIPKEPGQGPMKTFITFNATIPGRRMVDKEGSGSVKYFRDLLMKGLIREDIYKRLMAQYGIDPDAVQMESKNVQISAPDRSLTDENRSEMVEAENSSSEPASSEISQPPGDDKDLLNLLDDTLSNFTGDPEDAEPLGKEEGESVPESPEGEKPAASVEKVTRRVVRKSV